MAIRTKPTVLISSIYKYIYVEFHLTERSQKGLFDLPLDSWIWFKIDFHYFVPVSNQICLKITNERKQKQKPKSAFYAPSRNKYSLLKKKNDTNAIALVIPVFNSCQIVIKNKYIMETRWKKKRGKKKNNKKEMEIALSRQLTHFMAVARWSNFLLCLADCFSDAMLQHEVNKFLDPSVHFVIICCCSFHPSYVRKWNHYYCGISELGRGIFAYFFNSFSEPHLQSCVIVFFFIAILYWCDVTIVGRVVHSGVETRKKSMKNVNPSPKVVLGSKVDSIGVTTQPWCSQRWRIYWK